MTAPSLMNAPIRTRWLFEALFELRRVGRLLRHPRHEIGHRWERPSLRAYRTVLTRHRALPAAVRDRLAQIPEDFLSVYSMHRETVAWLYHETLRRQPQLLLEVGCGLSTVVTAMALESLSADRAARRLISLESEAEWRERTEAVLRPLGLTAWVELRPAPLVPFAWRGRTWQTYDSAAVADLSGIGQLLIDGPPAAVGREPVLPMLREHLAPGCRILLDDARRPAEREAVRQWQANGLARLRGSVPAGNGLAVLEAA